MTTVESFASALTDANTWLDEIGKALGRDDRHFALRALRSALHALRDRLTVEQNAHLSAQLPMLIRGIYFEGWRPGHSGRLERDLDGYLDEVASGFAEFQAAFDALDVARAVYGVVARRISEGELHKIVATMPHQLRPLWESL